MTETNRISVQAGVSRSASRLFPLAAAAFVMAAAKPGLAQNLLQNSSFEQGTNVLGFVLLCPPSPSITGWVVTRDCVHYCSTVWQAAAGVRSVDLDGEIGDTGGVAQTFATTPGARYQVSFSLAGNPDSGPAVKRLMVAAAGTQMEFTFSTAGRTRANMGWTAHTWEFTATGLPPRSNFTA